MRCQACGCDGPTKYVEFRQNIGALFMRFSSERTGNLCKPCINKFFWQMTLTTAAVGWFGIISLCLTPVFIINNIVYFCPTIGMKSPDDFGRARVEELSAHPTMALTPEARSKIEPHTAAILQRLQGGESLDRISMDIAPKIGVSAMQVELFVESMQKKQA